MCTKSFRKKNRLDMVLITSLYYTTDILYSGHLSTMDTFTGTNDITVITLITKPLCSGHFTANISFRSQFTVPHRNKLPLVDTPNRRWYKIFFERNLYALYFRQCFIVSFNFSSIFVLSLFSQLSLPLSN